MAIDTGELVAGLVALLGAQGGAVVWAMKRFGSQGESVKPAHLKGLEEEIRGVREMTQTNTLHLAALAKISEENQRISQQVADTLHRQEVLIARLVDGQQATHRTLDRVEAEMRNGIADLFKEVRA